MEKDLKGKELGVGIVQQTDGLYVADKKTLTISRSMEFRYKVGEWRVGTPKSKSGYRTIPLTDEAIRILKAQKEKIGITMNLYVHITEEEKLKEINLVAAALNVV